MLGLSLLLPAACNSRNSLFDGGAAPTAPTPPPGALVGLSVTPTGVMGGTPATGIIGLTGAAPAGGLLVSLTSSTPAVTVPATVVVPAGSERVEFPIRTIGVVTDIEAAITASSPAGSVEGRLGLWSEQPTYLSLWYEASPGGYVVGRRFTPSTAAFSLSCSGSNLALSIPGPGTFGTTRVILAAPSGTPLRPGSYEDVRSSSNTTTAPGFTVESAGINFCSAQNARFVIHEALFGAASEPVRRFSATFERRCTAGTLSVWGELRLTNVPNTSTFPGCLR